MIKIWYQISPRLRKNLYAIDFYRQKILLKPLSPSHETRIRFHALIARIHFYLLSEKVPHTEAHILRSFEIPHTSKPSPIHESTLKYKKAMDYITAEWTASQEPFGSAHIFHLYKLLYGKRHYHKIETSVTFLNELVDYLQVQTDHPAILAAILYIKLVEIHLFETGNEEVAQLTSLALLHKYGYDFKGLVIFEEFFQKEEIGISKAIAQAQQKNSLTTWLEFFSEKLAIQVEKDALQLDTTLPSQIPDKRWRLTDRQKSILDILKRPGATLTNRKVQSAFHISQVTASRDLAKLASIGLLVSHGKGRSIYYIKT